LEGSIKVENLDSKAILPFQGTDIDFFFNQIKSIGKPYFKMEELAYALSDQTV